MTYRYSVYKLETIAEHWWELISLAESGCTKEGNRINEEDWRGIVECKVDFERALEATRNKRKFVRMLWDGTVWLEHSDFREMARFLNGGK